MGTPASRFRTHVPVYGLRAKERLAEALGERPVAFPCARQVPSPLGASQNPGPAAFPARLQGPSPLLVCTGRQNKAPPHRGASTPEIHVLTVRRLDVHGRGVPGAGFSCDQSPWLVDSRVPRVLVGSPLCVSVRIAPLSQERRLRATHSTSLVASSRPDLQTYSPPEVQGSGLGGPVH